MGKKITTDDFVLEAKSKFGDQYDYSATVYRKAKSKVVLRCMKHDVVFEIRPMDHLRSKTGGCPICSQERRSQSNTVDSDDFFRRCRERHRNKYDYSEAVFTGTRNKIIIICPLHGRFEQQANAHVRGQGCPKCRHLESYERNRGTLAEFESKARVLFGDLYDYSQFVYINDRTAGIIICPEHGPFYKSPNHHLRGQGCPRCSGGHNCQRTQEEAIADCRRVHGDTYDLSKIVYRGTNHKIVVGCHEHGDFEIGWGHFMRGQGCPICRYIKAAKSKTKTTEKYISEARSIWGDRFDYSETIYKKGHEKLKIICRKHGPFWMLADNHINSTKPQGCPTCNQSRLERMMEDTLNQNGIVYEAQKHFEWLGRMSLDFYLPDFNIAIECQGIQHFALARFGGCDEETAICNLEETRERDLRKRSLCEQNGVKLLYFSNLGIEYPYQVYEDAKELINLITSKQHVGC